MLSIRTQDRMALIPYDKPIRAVEETKIEFVRGERVYNKTGKAFLSTETHYDRLGTYETKERALEVLDEIQIASMGKLIINDSSLYNPEFNNEYTIYLASGSQQQMIPIPYVYQMPKE